MPHFAERKFNEYHKICWLSLSLSVSVEHRDTVVAKRVLWEWGEGGLGVEETELCLVLWPWSLVYGAHFIINPDRIHTRGDTHRQGNTDWLGRETDGQTARVTGRARRRMNRQTDEERQTEADDRQLSHPTQVTAWAKGNTHTHTRTHTRAHTPTWYSAFVHVLPQ